MEEENNPLESIINNVSSAMSGIPAPIQKNLFKAITQLCSASIDVPVSYLEGQAALRRANTEARIKVIAKISENISTNIDVPIEYSDKAIERYASKIVKQQINLDKVVEHATTNLNNENYIESGCSLEITEDWLNVFEEIAKLKSNDDIQILFGKILSNEIKSPGQYSHKALNTISEIDSDVAKIFLKICNSSFYTMSDSTANLAFLPDFRINADSFDLQFFGISYLNLTKLQEYGLINATKSSLEINVDGKDDYLFHASKKYNLELINNSIVNKTINLTGWTFTHTGTLLLGILSLEENEFFLEKAINYFSDKSIIFKATT